MNWAIQKFAFDFEKLDEVKLLDKKLKPKKSEEENKNGMRPSQSGETVSRS